MPDSYITKKALAASLKKLIETTPLNKISIQKIVDDCGLNRQTFYYHFTDKYDLINWIYYTEAVESIADCRDYDHWSKGIEKILTYLSQNRVFYVNVLRTDAHHSFNRYFFEVTRQLIKTVVNEVAENMHVSEHDKDFVADFYTYAFVGITVQWIETGMKEAPESLAVRVKDLVDGSMVQALTRYAPTH